MANDFFFARRLFARLFEWRAIQGPQDFTLNSGASGLFWPYDKYATTWSAGKDERLYRLRKNVAFSGLIRCQWFSNVVLNI